MAGTLSPTRSGCPAFPLAQSTGAAAGLVIAAWLLAKAAGHKVSQKSFFFPPSSSRRCLSPSAGGTRSPGADKAACPLACCLLPAAADSLLFPGAVNSFNLLLLCYRANFNASCLCIYWFSWVYAGENPLMLYGSLLKSLTHLFSIPNELKAV